MLARVVVIVLHVYIALGSTSSVSLLLGTPASRSALQAWQRVNSPGKCCGFLKAVCKSIRVGRHFRGESETKRALLLPKVHAGP